MNLNKLRGLMAENNITKKELAEILNLSYSGIRKKLNGKSSFTIEQVQKLSNIFKVEINIFFKQYVH